MKVTTCPGDEGEGLAFGCCSHTRLPNSKGSAVPCEQGEQPGVGLGQQRLPLQPAFPFVCVGWSIRTWKKKGEISADLKENSQECKIKISFGHGLGAVVGGYRDKRRAHLHLN